jgi:hypothetical protein
MPNLTHDAIALYGKDALVWKYKACLYIDSGNGLLPRIEFLKI